MKHYDVVVVGAGIVGAAVARELTRRSLRVGIVERDRPCAGASGACNGGISYLGKTGEDLTRTVESLRLYRQLAGELGLGDAIDQSRPMILLGKTEEDRNLLQERVNACHQAGLDATFLVKDDLHRLVPALDPSVCWGAVAFGDLQGVVNPFRVTFGLLEDALKRGAELLSGEVCGWLLQGERVLGVRTGGESYGADAVVNCAGDRADDVWRELGIHMGIEPVQGVVLVTDRYPKRFPGSLMNVEFLRNNPPEVSLAIEQTLEGNILIGASKIRNRPERIVDRGIGERIAAYASGYVRGLEDLQVIRSYAGHRATREGGAFVGQIPSVEGLYGAVGFGGGGITLAPWAGQVMGDIFEQR